MKPLVSFAALALFAPTFVAWAAPNAQARALPVPLAPAWAPGQARAMALEMTQPEAHRPQTQEPEPHRPLPQGPAMQRAQEKAQKKTKPLELWNGLHLGMSRAEVRALHPHPTIFLGGSCRAQLKPIFRLGKLEAVRIGQYLHHNDCGREIYAALLRKYGAPSGQARMGYLDLSGLGNSYDFYWYNEGRAIKLRLLQSGRFNELSYAPDPAGGAMGLASQL